MAGWIALAVSVVALAVSGIAAAYAKRQAVAAEDANWLGDPAVFSASVEDPHTGNARLVISYEAGPALKTASAEIVNLDGPSPGFGVGRVESSTWDMGAVRVGDRRSTAIVQKASGSASGPAWQSGAVTLRIQCGTGRHSREVGASAEFPRQPWVY